MACANEKAKKKNQQKTIQWRRSKALERMGNFSGITCSLYVFTRHFKWLTMKNEEGRWQKKRIGSHRSSQHIRVITIFHHFQYMFLYMTRLPSTLSISFVALPTVTSQCRDCMQKRSLNTSLKLTLKQRSRWNTTKMVYVAAIQFRDQSMNHRNYQKMTKSCEILPQRIEKFSIFEWIRHNFFNKSQHFQSEWIYWYAIKTSSKAKVNKMNKICSNQIRKRVPLRCDMCSQKLIRMMSFMASSLADDESNFEFIWVWWHEE